MTEYNPLHLSTSLAYLEQIADDQELPAAERAWAEEGARFLAECMEQRGMQRVRPLDSVLLDGTTKH